MNELTKAYNALQAKQATYTALFNYYDGDQPVVYTNGRLRDIFANLDARFSENWCSVVIDTVSDRINLTGLKVADDEDAQAVLTKLWSGLSLQIEADDAHKAALTIGESFVIVWPDADDQVQVYYNDPRLCHVEYDAENPRVKAWAAKWWDDTDGKRRVTLYFPDRIEYYISRGKASNVNNAKAFIEYQPTEENPWGIVPVFHLRPERRRVKSDLVDVIPLQNGVNKLLIDMMVAAEFGAFRQKYVISQADTEALKNAPNEIWSIPAGDGVGQPTTVGEFGETNLANYLDAIDRLAAAIGAITRTPKHHFFGQGGDPSGEALLAMEAPLNKKAQDRIDRFTTEWRQIGAFMLLLSGHIVAADAIEPAYSRPETQQPKTQAEIRKLNVESGIPLRTQLRDEGRTAAWLEQLDQDKADEAAAAQLSLATALVDSQRAFDQGAS